MAHRVVIFAISTAFLFLNQPAGQTPQPIFTQNGLIDVDYRKDVPFAVKIETFQTADPADS